MQRKAIIPLCLIAICILVWSVKIDHRNLFSTDAKPEVLEATEKGNEVYTQFYLNM